MGTGELRSPVPMGPSPRLGRSTRASAPMRVPWMDLRAADQPSLRYTQMNHRATPRKQPAGLGMARGQGLRPCPLEKYSPSPVIESLGSCDLVATVVSRIRGRGKGGRGKCAATQRAGGVRPPPNLSLRCATGRRQPRPCQDRGGVIVAMRRASEAPARIKPRVASSCRKPADGARARCTQTTRRPRARMVATASSGTRL